MSDTFFNYAWLVLFIIICIVRKVYEYRSGRRATLVGSPLVESALMILWGIAAGITPLIYLFSSWLDFADLPVELPDVVRLIGILVFVFSIWLLHRSHVDLGTMWSTSAEPAADHELIMTGVYKRVRHPMYAAHISWGIAQALLFPNILAGPLALLLILVLLVLRVPREEKAMLRIYDGEYRRYMEATNRIVPRL